MLFTVRLPNRWEQIRRVAMSVVTSLWASVQGDPVVMRRLNGWLTVFWIIMIPVSFLTGWISSVQYVSMLSLWALVSGHWSAWQAARVEVNQEHELQHREKNPIEDRVVSKLVSDTEIEALPPECAVTTRLPRTDQSHDALPRCHAVAPGSWRGVERGGDMSDSANVDAGQRWKSNIGGASIVVLEKAADGGGRWLVKYEDNGVMTTIDEWQLLDDYDLAGSDDIAG